MKGMYLLILLTCSALAQEVSFDVTPKQVGINESVYFIIKVNNSGNGIAPEFPRGFNSGDFVLEESEPSISIQQRYVNGVGSSSRSFTYILSPRKKGKLVFPAQQVTVAGQTYRTESVPVEVGDEVRSIGGLDPIRDPFSRRRDRDAELFVTMGTPRDTYYQGESIPLTIEIWRTPGLDILNQGSSVDLPDFRDFWTEEVARSPSRDELKIRDGRRWQVTFFAEKRLFATKPGQLTIQPAVFNLMVRTGFFDRERVSRSTDAINLTIKPLPNANRPADFSGAVGKFQANGSIDRTSAKVGETISLVLEISGDGYFAALDNPELPGLAGDFELFPGGPPETGKKDGITYSKKWIYALVPKRTGNFTIELPRLSYFNPATGRYENTQQQSFPLEVLPGQALVSSRPSKDGSELLRNRNLAFIKLGELGAQDARLKLRSPRLLVQVLVGFIVLDLLVFLILLWRSRALGRRRDLRPRFALKNFRKAQARLRSLADDPDRFYAGLSQAVFDYFGDKWERAGQGISLEMIHDHFDRQGIDREHYLKLAECVEACDLARFTPTTPSSRESLLEKAAATLAGIEGALT